jgi:hypothetical protein
MKIALLNAFPNLLHSAEREFIERGIAVLRALGHEARSVVTSDETIAFNPDLVILTHEFAAKTTDHFTVGLLWSPTQFYRGDEGRVKSIRSWDLVVPINAATRRYARSIHFPLRHRTAVSDLDFFPSAPAGQFAPPAPSKLNLVYVGAHWDGLRHKQMLEELAKLTDLHIYGPPKAWEFLPGSYRGMIPFDGSSLFKTLNQHGIVLALHKREHVEEETPTMRVFEACAARCAVITEPMQPLVDLFGDSLHYVDRTQSPVRLARNVAAIVERYQADPALFTQTTARAHERFLAKASLERLMGALLEEVAARKALHNASPVAVSSASMSRPTLEVSAIVRCGSRPLSIVERAVASLAAQTHPRIGLILVRFAEIDGFDAWVQDLRASGRFTFVNVVQAPGKGLRSAAWWAGLRAVQSDAFCVLDDDDELFRDHIAHLVEVLEHDPECDLAYCGVVKQEEDGLFLNTHLRFGGEGGVTIEERRALHFMDDFNLDRLLRFDNYIQSNAWVARRHVLTEDVLDDPELEVAEDMYFYLLLASRFRFRFSGRATALWNWRSNAGDNSMRAVSQYRWAQAVEALCRRLGQVPFPGGFEGRDVLGVGRVSRRPLAAPASRQATLGAAQGAAAPALSKVLVKRLLRVASGGGCYLKATDPPPCDPADIVCSIDFTQTLLPESVANVRGLSAVEPWGCWTDGPRLVLELRSPLPPRFTLYLIGHAHLSNHELPLAVSAGGEAVTLRMSARTRACRYSVAMVSGSEANSLVIEIPNPVSPASVDKRSPETRRLGIGLVRLDIVER